MGRYGASMLEPTVHAGVLTLVIHPTMTFTGTSLDVVRPAGHPLAVTTPIMLLSTSWTLVTGTGGTPVVVAEEDRGLYHTTLAHGTNHLVTPVTQSTRVLEAIRVEAPDAYLAPLLQVTLDDTLGSGGSALAEPVAHGDVGAVHGHLASLDVLVATGDLVDVSSTYYVLARVAAV